MAPPWNGLFSRLRLWRAEAAEPHGQVIPGGAENEHTSLARRVSSFAATKYYLMCLSVSVRSTFLASAQSASRL